VTPTRAGHGPAAGDQQPLGRCQSSMLAVVDPEAGAATVTSWAAPAVLASSLARVGGHAVDAAWADALGGGLVVWRLGLDAAVAGDGATLGGGVVAVGFVVFVALAAGCTDAGRVGATASPEAVVTGGATVGFSGEAHAPARRAIPSAVATAVRCGLKAMTRHGNKRGALPPLSFC
jgi:hypothetical protein